MVPTHTSAGSASHSQPTDVVNRRLSGPPSDLGRPRRARNGGGGQRSPPVPAERPARARYSRIHRERLGRLHNPHWNGTTAGDHPDPSMHRADARTARPARGQAAAADSCTRQPDRHRVGHLGLHRPLRQRHHARSDPDRGLLRGRTQRLIRAAPRPASPARCERELTRFRDFAWPNQHLGSAPQRARCASHRRGRHVRRVRQSRDVVVDDGR